MADQKTVHDQSTDRLIDRLAEYQIFLLTI